MAFGLNVNLDVTKVMGSTKFLRYRVVTLTSGDVVNHTTGVTTGGAGVRIFGVAQDQPRSFPSTQGKIAQPIRVIGISKVQGSTKAIKVGSFLCGTTGAVASTSFLGGCCRATTAAGQGVHVFGIALTSQAASATPGYISAFVSPIGRA